MNSIDKLTPRQRDFLEAVESLTAAAGIPPSLSELADRLGIGVTRAANLGRECIARGVVTQRPRTPRSWQIVSPSTGRRRSR